MNYRHAYHAGNFADVLKHAVLALAVEHLKRKPAPFRIIDTHAGVGLYDLSSVEAAKTGEWRDGIGRLMAEPLPDDVAAILKPYLDLVAGENTPGTLTRYPGSPLIARRLMRAGDALVVNELHPADHERLEEIFARDRQTKVMSIDGWLALKSLLPPKERRGLVLVDPPFEEPGEMQRLVRAVVEATKRFASGIFILWYPVKDPAASAALEREITALALPKVLSIELFVRAPSDVSLLNGTGLTIVNPPYQMREQLAVMLPFLAERLARGSGARSRLASIGVEPVA